MTGDGLPSRLTAGQRVLQNVMEEGGSQWLLRPNVTHSNSARDAGEQLTR